MEPINSLSIDRLIKAFKILKRSAIKHNKKDACAKTIQKDLIDEF